jgi:tetratricopeptide (TPR) repeat protein
MYLRRAKQASKGGDNEVPISFKLMQFEVKNSRSPQHGLTIVNSFLKTYPGKTKEALEALSIKAELLEKRLSGLTSDKEEEERIRKESDDIRRYLITRGTNVAESVLILANRYYSSNEYLRALEVLERAGSLRPVPAEILNLKARVLLELKEYDQRKDTLYTLATAYRTTTDGENAANLLKKDREAELEQTVSNIHSIPVISHRLAFYLAEADDNELKSAKQLLEQLNRTLEEKGKMTPEIRLLIGKGLIRGENYSGGAKMVVMALKEMNESKTPPSNKENIEITLLAAEAQTKGNNKTAAWELLETISDESDEAVLRMARLQMTGYRDEKQAEPLFEKLIKPGTSFRTLTESYLNLAEIKYKGKENTDKYIKYLKDAASKIPSEFSYSLSRKLGEKEDSKLQFGQSVQWWIKAADNAPSEEEKAQCEIEAIKAMLESKQLQRASQKMNQLLSSGVPVSYQKQMQQLLKETSANEQLSSLRNALNWDDPENMSNFKNLKKMAQLYISPLGQMEKAQAIITQAIQIFPGGTKNAEVQEIIRTIPLITRINQLEQKASAPEDYYHLARLCEDEAGDSEKACEFYRTLTEKWPDHKYTPLALMYLVRLEGLVLNQPQKSLEHLQQLLNSDVSKRLSPRLTAFVSLKAASQKLTVLYKKATTNTASGRELVELGKIAATELSDPATVKLALEKLAGINGFKNEAYKLAILAASSLEPQALITPGGATPEYFLKEAINLADSSENLSKAHLLMGIHKIESRQLILAMSHFNVAIETSPGSDVAEDALFRTAEILETMLNEEERARTIYSEIANSGKNSQNVQIASTRSERLTEKLAVDGLIDETHKEAVSKKSAVLYFYTGRQLQKDTKSLEQALTAFRTYTRLGQNPPILIKAYKSAAETLVRLERPAEAIEELEKLISAFPEMIDKEETLMEIAKIREVNLADYDGAMDIYKRVARSSSPRKMEGEEGSIRIAKLRKELLRSQEVGLSAEAASDEVKNIRNEFLQGKKKNWSGAAEALKEQIENTKSPFAQLPLLLELGSIQDKNLKEYENAVQTYDAFLNISKDNRRNGDVMLRKGDIEIGELKQPEEALATYEKWLDTFFSHSRRVEVMLKVAELKETQLDRTQEALDEYIIIAASYPRSGYDEKALMRLANLQQTYYADFQAAITAYSQITERFPFGDWADDSQFYIGQLYEIELGDLIKAKEEYQKVIDLYPASPFTGKARDALIRIERKN